jgi:hypothetical protein
VPGESPVKVKPQILDIFLGELHAVCMDVYLRVINVTWIDLDSLTSILHFLNESWIASRSVYSFCEVMVGSLSVVTMQYRQQRLLW